MLCSIKKKLHCFKYYLKLHRLTFLSKSYKICFNFFCYPILFPYLSFFFVLTIRLFCYKNVFRCLVWHVKVFKRKLPNQWLPVTMAIEIMTWPLDDGGKEGEEPLCVFWKWNKRTILHVALSVFYEKVCRQFLYHNFNKIDFKWWRKSGGTKIVDIEEFFFFFWVNSNTY